MGIKVTVRIGGEAGSTVWDATDQVATFDDGSPLLDVGHMYGGDGNACQWQFVVDDDIGEIPRADLTKNLASHHVVTVTEDASGAELWIGRGRIADKGWGRKAYHYGDARGALVTVDDGNIDFRLLALVADWVRPAESGRARLLAAIAAFCNGSPRLTTVIGTHLVAAGGEVTMPAHTYPAGTELPEIFRDCATTEGKLWGDVIHHDGGSHLCMLYIDDQDHSTYPSTLSITDDGPDHVTSFPPSWRQGDASLESGGENPISHLVNRYGASGDTFVVVENAGIIEQYDYAAASFNDSLSETSGQAQARAAAIANSRRMEHVTHQPTIRLPADMVHLVEAGMSIDMKSAASMGGLYLGTTQTRRVAQAKKVLVAPETATEPALYDVHLQLDRPEKRLPERKGTPPIFNPPASPFEPLNLLGVACSNSGSNFGSDHPAWSGDQEERVEITAASSVAVGDSMVAVVAWNQLLANVDTVYDERGNTWTKDAEYENTGSSLDDTIQIWHCNVTTAIQAGDYIRWAVNLTSSLLPSQEIGGRCLGVYSYSGSLTVATVGTGAGAISSAPSINTPAGGLVVAGASIGGPSTVSGDGDWDAMIPDTDQAGAGFLGKGIFAQQLTAASATTWTIGLSQALDWAAIAVSYTTEGSGGATSQPPGEAGPGDEDAAAREDHVHPPGIVSDTDPTANDDSGDGHEVGLIWVNETTNTAYVLVDDTEGAAVWQEIGDADAVSTVTAHGAMGTTEDFDHTDGQGHTATLDDDVTITLSGATAGEEAWLTLVITGSGGPHTMTWPASVSWPGDDAPTPPADGEALVVTLYSVDGGTIWYGSYPGTGGTDAADRRILLADDRSTPFDFTDMLQMDDGSDFMWSD